MIKRTPQHFKLGIIIDTERNRYPGGGSDFVHVYGRVVAIVDGKVRNSVRDYGRFNGGLEDIYGLTANSQGDGKEPGRLYGFDALYLEAGHIDERKAGGHYRTLRTINGKLRKMQEARGYVKTFGEYVGRLAEVLGKDTVIIRTVGKGAGWSHDDNRYDFLTIGDGVRWIDDTVVPSLWPSSQPHVIGTEAPTPENDPAGRMSPKFYETQ